MSSDENLAINAYLAGILTIDEVRQVVAEALGVVLNDVKAPEGDTAE